MPHPDARWEAGLRGPHMGVCSVERKFREVWVNDDEHTHHCAQDFLDGRFLWLEQIPAPGPLATVEKDATGTTMGSGPPSTHANSRNAD